MDYEVPETAEDWQEWLEEAPPEVLLGAARLMLTCILVIPMAVFMMTPEAANALMLVFLSIVVGVVTWIIVMAWFDSKDPEEWMKSEAGLRWLAKQEQKRQE